MGIGNDFNPVIYRAKYADLAHLSDLQLESHWINHGKREGRTCFGKSRRQLLMDGIDKADAGLEIAPYFSPLAPKAYGYSIKILDVYDKRKLLELALADPSIPNEYVQNIEDVDFIGSASMLKRTISSSIPQGGLEYIVSSHNFEHLPDPIGFLRDASYYLSPLGSLRMAIPDLRCCFDFYQWPTMLHEWLEAFYSGKQRPSKYDIFRQRYIAVNNFGRLSYPRSLISLQASLVQLHSTFVAEMDLSTESYEDTHCSFFVPSSFALLIHELRCLDLINLKIVHISETEGNEFIVHLGHSGSAENKQLVPNMIADRQQLLSNINHEISVKSSDFDEVLTNPDPIHLHRPKKGISNIKRLINSFLKIKAVH